MLHVARGRDQSYLAAYVQIHAALVVTNGIRNVEDCATSSRGQGTVGHGAASGQEKEYSAVDESRNNVTAWADGQVSHGAMEAVRGQLPGGGWVVGCGLWVEVELWPSGMGKPRSLGVQGAPEAARGGERPIRATSA